MQEIKISVDEKVLGILKAQSKFTGNSLEKQTEVFLKNKVEEWYSTLSKEQQDFLFTLN